LCVIALTDKRFGVPQKMWAASVCNDKIELNPVIQMRLGIDAAKKAGGVCEAVVCYSGDVASPKETKYTLNYYLDFIDLLVQEGIHVLGIKDMAGLLKPEAAKM
jgi:pyruvate carboxylase